MVSEKMVVTFPQIAKLLNGESPGLTSLVDEMAALIRRINNHKRHDVPLDLFIEALEKLNKAEGIDQCGDRLGVQFGHFLNRLKHLAIRTS